MPEFTLHIENLRFETIVGILEHERNVPQMVQLDVEIVYRREGESFINYALVAQWLQTQMQRQKFLLLEDALLALTEGLKSQYSTILSIKLKILKLDILDDCEVGIEIFKNY